MVKLVSEKNVAKHLISVCEREKGVIIFKMHPLTFAGIPDYLVLLARSPRVFFVETKTSGKECTPLQINTHIFFKRKVGIDTYVLDKKPETFNEIFEFGYTEYESYHYNKNPFKEKHKQFIIQNV